MREPFQASITASVNADEDAHLKTILSSALKHRVVTNLTIWPKGNSTKMRLEEKRNGSEILVFQKTSNETVSFVSERGLNIQVEKGSSLQVKLYDEASTAHECVIECIGHRLLK